MPDHLKDTLLGLWNGDPEQPHGMRLSDVQLPNPQLDLEKALMRLSGAYPQAMEVSESGNPLSDSYVKMLGAEAMIHPFAPNTILHRSDLGSQPRRDLETILAHELSHVGSMRQQKGPIDRMLTALLGKARQSYDTRDEELNAEASAQDYISRASKRWHDIPLQGK